MLSDDQVRRLALALPEAEEGLHRGQPSFQVGSQVFTTLMSGERQAVVRLPMASTHVARPRRTSTTAAQHG